MTDDEVFDKYRIAYKHLEELNALVRAKENDWSRGGDTSNAYLFAVANIRANEMMRSVTEFHCALLMMRNMWRQVN